MKWLAIVALALALASWSHASAAERANNNVPPRGVCASDYWGPAELVIQEDSSVSIAIGAREYPAELDAINGAELPPALTRTAAQLSGELLTLADGRQFEVTRYCSYSIALPVVVN